MTTHDVVVVGAGPVGLWLAGELRLAGVWTVVLERLDEPGPAPIPCGFVRVSGYDAADQEPGRRTVTMDELRATAVRIAGTDFGMRDARWLSRFGNATRHAATYRKGRVLLAGDAAHVNNPIGGMGLNGGIQDAVSLSDRLAGILVNRDPDRLLDLYDLQRRTVAVEHVQEQSIANKKRLEASDPETRRKNLDDLRQIAADPARARQFLLRTAMIASQRRAATIELAEATP